MITDPKTPSPKRQQEIFLAALEKRDPAERAAYLDAACAGNEALRKRVEELLQEEKDMGTFLENPALSNSSTPSPVPLQGPTGTVIVPELTEKSGDFIGHYKLLQKIGEGGCGVVYMAQQEKPVRRRVALKIIKLGMDTKQVIARFEAERQALALMDHPNIAKVLEAGATETGRPYFVMELVRGIKITEYYDQNNLPTEERLRLFVQVCNAIQHAHQKGIIHRDIKPSNILVTSHDGTPVPKVIDFGIAKATNQQRLTDLTVFTAFEQFIGTPAYMSPEQAEMSGLDIDTRTDIYSLGVQLYELLTGKTPFDAEALIRGGLDECRRTIREAEPVWPSTRLATLLEADLTDTAKHRGSEAPRLISLLRGDLDWIVMKAIEKDRTRRFATANDFAADVERYLNNEPVLARPPSGWYRFQKLVRRHQTAFSAAALIALTLLTGAAVSIWLAVRATNAEHEARKSQVAETQARQAAEVQQKRANEQAALARLNEYVADVNLAQQSLVAGNFGRATQLLKKHRPKAGEADLRGFEWHYLWQLARGDEHASLPAQDGSVQSLSVSPRGDLLAVGLKEKLNIWDLRNRTLLKTFSKQVESMVFLTDGKALITSSRSGVRIWNTTDWTEEKSLPRSSAPVALSHDGARLATGSEQGVKVWDTATWADPLLLRGSRGPVAFSNDGKLLATDSSEGITVWKVLNGEVAVVLEGSTDLFMPWFGGANLLAFSPDGHFIVSPRNKSSKSGIFVLSIWDTSSGKEVGLLPKSPGRIEHTGGITSLAFSPDGRTLATASMDHSVCLWDFEAREPVATLHGHLNEVWGIAFLPDGQTVVSGAKDGGVKLWPVRSEKKEDVLTVAHHPLLFSKDGRTLVALDSLKNKVVFLNLATGESEQDFQLEPRVRGHRPFRLALSADLGTMAEPTGDGIVKLWNTKTREAVTLKVCDVPVDVTILSPDGRQLITGGFQQPLRWWDLATGTNQVLGNAARRASFSPDGQTLAVYVNNNRSDDALEFWDVRKRSLRSSFVLEKSPLFNVVFSPDSRMLVTTGGPGERDNAIRLWNVATGQLVGIFTGHKQAIWSAAFSADGRTLASSSDDGTLKLWSVSTQQELLSINRLGGPVSELLFSPDGQTLVGGNGNIFESTGIRFYRAPLLTETDAGVQTTNATISRF